MKFKSVNLLLNGYCNNKCNMCYIWKNKERANLPLEEIINLFSHKEFSEVEDISLSGGEPLMIDGISNIIGTIIDRNPKLEMAFLNTNGTYPIRTRIVCEEQAKRVPQFYVSVSLEGPRDLNKKIRGIDTYDLAIKTLKEVKSLGIQNIKTIISTTLQRENGTIENLEYLLDLAEKVRSTLTFRFVEISTTYYQNEGTTPGTVPKETKLEILNFATKNIPNDKFLRVQKEFVETGQIPIMLDQKGNLLCKAGDLFCFVKYDSNIYPCLYSTRIIGTTSTGVNTSITDLGDKEPCPCCTECHIYPMLNYLK